MVRIRGRWVGHSLMVDKSRGGGFTIGKVKINMTNKQVILKNDEFDIQGLK